jgi:hypothetical protein
MRLTIEAMKKVSMDKQLEAMMARHHQDRQELEEEELNYLNGLHQDQ